MQQAQKYGAKEAILVDASGNWLETSTGNLWGWQDGRWWTPPVAAGILAGLIREQLINRLHSQNKKVRTRGHHQSFLVAETRFLCVRG
ncbi:aminotransferase class IV [Microseira sp. BLCC-F43]|uniref:aminotransferase class IV n=1 Tax=Microseira sp. BLCC-F43 TaxID=3153602 RepID=UPI0035B7FEE6